MATTYQFLGESSGLHYTHSQGGKLALASAPNTPLSSFAFLDGSEADILQIFHCPAKTYVVGMGLSITTASALAQTWALGTGVSAAGFGAAKAINATGVQTTLNDDAYGGDYMTGWYLASADTLDVTSATADSVDGVVDVFALVGMN
jgi:hypothetical protein